MSAPPAAPSDSSPTAPADSITSDLLDTRSRLPGIVFGTFNMENAKFSSVYTGSLRGGGVTPSNIVSLLSDARARGARLVLKLCNGRDSFVKNGDGSFSFSKWKALIDGYRNVDLTPFINDGTLIGHYLIDEPHMTAKWGGRVIPQATIEDMARHSKQIWPSMTTFVRTMPSWLASSSVTYTYLDAGWAQYQSGKGDATAWAAAEVAAAKRKGLGVAVGLNVLDGGNGSSGIAGWSTGKYAMSANEIRSYAGAMLGQSHACAFFMWMYDAAYYGRSDIKTAMTDVSARARSHVKTSCRQ